MIRFFGLAFAIAIIASLYSAQETSAHHGGKRCGSASWYSLPGNRTANGERMNPNAMTAAHRSFRFGTKVRVTNRRNGRSVIVRINDRGPFTKGRMIYVSKKAAAKLGFLRRGHTGVCIERVG